MNKARIGVFDSGLGGLSVVRSLLGMEPSASVIYLADTAHVPYGPRPLEEVKGFALAIVEYLVAEGAQAILMACNMSSALALDEARLQYPEIPVAGVIEAGARAAVKAEQGAIGVLATLGTVSSGGYPRVIERMAPGRKVIQAACPKFVPFVESGELDSPDVRSAALEYMREGLDWGVRTFILGCTHYPFLLEALKASAPDGTRFVDPAEEAAKEILNSLGDRLDTVTPSRYLLTAPSATFRPVGTKFVGMPLPELELVSWAEDGRKLRIKGNAITKATD